MAPIDSVSMVRNRLVLMSVAACVASVSGIAQAAPAVATETAQNTHNFVLTLAMRNFVKGAWSGDANFTISACPQAGCRQYLSGPIKIGSVSKNEVTDYEGFFPVAGSSCAVRFEQVSRGGMDSGDYRLTLVSKDKVGKGCSSLPAELAGVYKQVVKQPRAEGVSSQVFAGQPSNLWRLELTQPVPLRMYACTRRPTWPGRKNLSRRSWRLRTRKGSRRRSTGRLAARQDHVRTGMGCLAQRQVNLKRSRRQARCGISRLSFARPSRRTRPTSLGYLQPMSKGRSLGCCLVDRLPHSGVGCPLRRKVRYRREDQLPLTTHPRPSEIIWEADAPWQVVPCSPASIRRLRKRDAPWPSHWPVDPSDSAGPGRSLNNNGVRRRRAAASASSPRGHSWSHAAGLGDRNVARVGLFAPKRTQGARTLPAAEFRKVLSGNVGPAIETI
jgi:hypothetical protein